MVTHYRVNQVVMYCNLILVHFRQFSEQDDHEYMFSSVHFR